MQYKLLQTATDFEVVRLILLRMASACEHSDLYSKAQDRLKKCLQYFHFFNF